MRYFLLGWIGDIVNQVPGVHPLLAVRTIRSSERQDRVEPDGVGSGF